MGDNEKPAEKLAEKPAELDFKVRMSRGEAEEIYEQISRSHTGSGALRELSQHLGAYLRSTSKNQPDLPGVE